MMLETELQQALHELGMDARNYRVLPLLPLVQVAWADGAVQEAEREMILGLARNEYKLSEEGLMMLRNWLQFPPSHDYVQRGQQALVALCAHNHELSLRGDILEDVVQLSHEIAKSAGGFFGFGAVDRAEAESIEQIASALQISGAQRWVAPEDQTMVPIDADENNDGPAVTVEVHVDPDLRSRATLLLTDFQKGDTACPITRDGVSIGRAREATIQILYDGQVSRSHCKVAEEPHGFYIDDLKSTCGTWVNGQRVERRRLLGGEEICVGSAVFHFQLSPSD